MHDEFSAIFNYDLGGVHSRVAHPVSQLFGQRASLKSRVKLRVGREPKGHSLSEDSES